MQFGVRESAYNYYGLKQVFSYNPQSGILVCKENNRQWQAGRFSTPSL